MTYSDYKNIAADIPKDPGIYKFLDAKGSILYVGKAKNLKNRLASYFGEKEHQHAKTRVMIKHAHHIEFTLVETEYDALLLENSLIKKHQPRYNVMLKDEKSPLIYLCIKKERFPRVFITRKTFRDGSTYFGPYLNKFRVEQIAELIRKLFQLRTCNLALTEDNIRKNKFKPCLEFHLKNCAAPCVNAETETTYNAKIEQIRNILKGNFAAVKSHLKSEMQVYSERLMFEMAQQTKDKLLLFEDYQGKSTVVNPAINDVDVFAIADAPQEAFVNFLKVVNGAIIHTYTLTLTKNLDDDQQTLLLFAIANLRERFHSLSPEIIVPFPLTLPNEEPLLVTVPRIGDKKKLLDLSEKNAQYHLLLSRRQAANQAGKQTPAERILRTLQADLNMEAAPLHLECFDNSNLQGTHPVSSCVVFKNAKPSKRDYRHYHVKSVEGPNDFASMEEVVFRRYRRLLAEEQPLPQLIIIDGGKGQLSSAMKSLTALGIQSRVTVIGIAKKLEEIFFPEDSVPLYINKKSESLKLIQQARNEAHRFAISFHRDQRSRNLLHTELTEIAGVGPKLAEKLLQNFGSVAKIRRTEQAELTRVAGKKVAQNLIDYFNQHPK
jgi:excinuclease ABC subunit C